MTYLLTLVTALTLSGPLPQRPDEPVLTDSFKADPAWKSLGKDVWFDPKSKRLVVRARIALQEGALEHLLCKKGTKEHESVLATEAPAKLIHAGLLLTGATPGHPVRFEPKFEPPKGDAIAIEVEWEQAGKWKKVDAREWVQDQKSKKALDQDWVFAGSEIFEDPRTKTPIYAADDGDLITVANFPASILDLPYRSSSSDADRGYVSFTEKVPVRGTPVTMYFQPRPAPEKKKSETSRPADR